MPRVQTVLVNGPKLRQIRKERGLSPAQVATRTGRQPSSIRTAENTPGKRVSKVLAAQIALALGVGTTDFVLQNEPGPRPGHSAPVHAAAA